MNKEKLIKLRCKVWGITEDEYYCNQCGDFSLEDMAKAYRRGKNQSREKIAELEQKLEQTEKDLSDYQFNYPTIKELQKENKELKEKLNEIERKRRFNFVDLLHDVENESKQEEQLTKAKDLLAKWVELYKPKLEGFSKTPIQVDTEQFLNEIVPPKV